MISRHELMRKLKLENQNKASRMIMIQILHWYFRNLLLKLNKRRKNLNSQYDQILQSLISLRLFSHSHHQNHLKYSQSLILRFLYLPSRYNSLLKVVRMIQVDQQSKERRQLNFEKLNFNPHLINLFHNMILKNKLTIQINDFQTFQI